MSDNNLVEALEKIVRLCKKYRELDGKTSIGNHIENECNEMIALHSSGREGEGQEAAISLKDAEYVLSEFICRYAPHHSQIESPGMFLNRSLANKSKHFTNG